MVNYFQRFKGPKTLGTIVQFPGATGPVEKTMSGITLKTESGAVIAVVNPAGGEPGIVIIKDGQSINASLTNDEYMTIGYYMEETATP